ncbi:MAG TPA: MBL fold metallo-hydrolase [Pseudonocardiaceae bacterium]|nr:MBL fold metallo-hydrolase [Pseudonocardiaceae bacterium]
MHLIVLGCSGSIPGPDAPASGYLVEAGDRRIAVDLGNGTLAAYQGTGRDPFDLDALVLSHLHPDHCADFAALTVLRRYHPAPTRDPRREPLPVYAPREAPTRLAAAYAPDAEELAETDLSDVYTFHALADETVDLAGLSMTTGRVAHPCEAYAMRFDDAGSTLCYTGDSGVCSGLDAIAEGADVLLAEASWTHAPGRPADLHLSGREAGELAARAGVGRLLITHVPPWTEPKAVLAEARAAYSGDVHLVEAGAVYEI